jgi:hypothetical protein
MNVLDFWPANQLSAIAPANLPMRARVPTERSFLPSQRPVRQFLMYQPQRMTDR